MFARCLTRGLTDEQRRALNVSARFNPQFQVTSSKEYLILGISFIPDSTVYGNSCLYMIQDDAGRCVSVPSALFDITDPRVSQYWVARSNGKFGVTLWPEEFYEEYFHDRVTDSEPEALATLRTTVGRLEAEFGVMATGADAPERVQ